MRRRYQVARRVAIPVPIRAIAIPIRRGNDDRTLSLIHALLALMIPLFLLALTGCESADYNGEKVDYGPQADGKELSKALQFMTEGSDLKPTKIGAFVHFETSNSVAGGSVRIISSDTGQTVVNKREDADYIYFDITEKVVEYSNGGANEKLSRMFELPVKKVLASVESGHGVSDTSPGSTSVEDMRAAIRAYVSGSAENDDDEKGPALTFHRLRTWRTEGPPPDKVRNQPGCLGIPNCQITYRHMSFDIVVWDVPQGTLIRIDMVTSPNVPQTIGLNMNPIFSHFPGLVKSCLTQMVSISDDARVKTLLAQCKEVRNFTFDASAPLTP